MFFPQSNVSISFPHPFFSLFLFTNCITVYEVIVILENIFVSGASLVVFMAIYVLFYPSQLSPGLLGTFLNQRENTQETVIHLILFTVDRLSTWTIDIDVLVRAWGEGDKAALKSLLNGLQL